MVPSAAFPRVARHYVRAIRALARATVALIAIGVFGMSAGAAPGGGSRRPVRQ